METIDKVYECANCAQHIKQSELKDIKRYHERVDEEDEIEPDGECPHCGCLAYEVKAPVWKPNEFKTWIIDFLCDADIGPDDLLVSVGPQGVVITDVRSVVDILIDDCSRITQQTFKDKALELKSKKQDIVGLLSAIATTISKM